MPTRGVDRMGVKRPLTPTLPPIMGKGGEPTEEPTKNQRTKAENQNKFTTIWK